MKKFVSAILILGLAVMSTPASEAAGKATSAKYIKNSKIVVKKVSPKRSKSITAAYVTTDTTTAVTPVDTRTAVTPIDTHTAVVPADTRTTVVPTPAPAPAAVSLSGDQLIKLMELFAKLAVTNNVNTTSNNVVTPITVAPQIITQTVVTPTVSAPVVVAAPIQQALTLLSVKHDSDDHHDSDHR